MPTPRDENVRNFILDLTELSRKYKLMISGCGCCSSPSIDPIPDAALHDKAGYITENGGNLAWEDGKYFPASLDEVIR